MPILLTPQETLLRGLHDSEIRCGVQNEPPAGGITAWIDFGSRTKKATFYETIVGDRQVWPAADRSRLFGDGDHVAWSTPLNSSATPHGGRALTSRYNALPQAGVAGQH
jgi:hypothetical protein